MQILAFLIAAAIPLLSLYLIYKLDLYKTGQYSTVFLSFGAGALGLLAAVSINRAVLGLGLPRDTVIRFTAPVIEEILKGLLLLYLVRRPNFTYFVEGAVYGFAAGIGFAIAENIQYIAAAGSAGMAVAIGRVISTNLIHATTTAVLGIALGWARFKPGFSRALISMAGLLAAMLLHVAFNNLVTRVSSGMLLIYAGACGLCGAGLVAFAIRRGLKEEKAWLEEKLGAADRVTKSEAAVVQRMEKAHEILKPLAERFGPQKAAQIERFLIIQARLGLLRKSLDKLTDVRMQKSIEEQMGKLRAEMDTARRQVGVNAMLYLRLALPADSSPLWGRLEAAIQDQTAARPAAGGTNLWANLKARQETRAISTEKPNPENE